MYTPINIVSSASLYEMSRNARLGDIKKPSAEESSLNATTFNRVIKYGMQTRPVFLVVVAVNTFCKDLHRRLVLCYMLKLLKS